MATDKLRLFIGVGVPPARVELIHESLGPLRSNLDARWPDPRNAHLTLRFLGWVPGDQRVPIEEVCEKITARVPRGELRLQGLGAFPHPRRARVIWAGVIDPAGLLTRLVASLERPLSALGFEPEKRDYVPHLTLARLRVPARLPELPELPPRAEDPFPLSGLRLYRSHMARAGARYEVLREFDLLG